MSHNLDGATITKLSLGICKRGILTMLEPIHEFDYLCFNCGEVFSAKGNEVKCPVCGFTVDEDKYIRIARYADNAIEWGYFNRFESKYPVPDENGVVTLYQRLLPDNALCFIAVVILSRIIGGFPKELEKMLSKKIYMKSKTAEWRIDEVTKDIMANNAMYSDFATALTCYYLDIDPIDDQIVKLALEHPSIKQLNTMRWFDLAAIAYDKWGEDQYFAEMSKKIIQNYQKAQKNPKKLKLVDFIGFWQDVHY